MADKIDHSLIKTDLYDAVNGEWLKTATIPGDHQQRWLYWPLR